MDGYDGNGQCHKDLFQTRKNHAGKNTVLDEPLFIKYNISIRPAPLVKVFNIREIKGITSDDFTFETNIKANADSCIAPCRRMEISLIVKGDLISVPIASKGCIGAPPLYIFGKVTESKTADLSGFGCDVGDWVKVRLESKKGIIKIFVNGRG